MSNRRELAEGIAAFFGTYTNEKKERRRDNEDLRRWQMYYQLQKQNADINLQNAQLQREAHQAEIERQRAVARQAAEARATLEALYPGMSPELIKMADPLWDNERADRQFEWRQSVDRQRLGLEAQRLARAGTARKGPDPRFPKLPSIEQDIAGTLGESAWRMYATANRGLERTQDRLSRHLQQRSLYVTEYGAPVEGKEEEAKQWQSHYETLQRAYEGYANTLDSLEMKLLPEEEAPAEPAPTAPATPPPYKWSLPKVNLKDVMGKAPAPTPPADDVAAFFGGMKDPVKAQANAEQRRLQAEMEALQAENQRLQLEEQRRKKLNEVGNFFFGERTY